MDGTGGLTVDSGGSEPGLKHVNLYAHCYSAVKLETLARQMAIQYYSFRLLYYCRTRTLVSA